MTNKQKKPASFIAQTNRVLTEARIVPHQVQNHIRDTTKKIKKIHI